MIIGRFYAPGLAQVAYGVSDPTAGKAAIIDPRRDVDVYLDWVASSGCTIIAILETHVHADFVSGARELAAATGAPIYAARLGASEFSHRPLDDGDVVQVGNLTLQAFWTPGHTPEHLSYLLFDPDTGEEPIVLFSGDVLFAGEIGRPDLLGADQQHALIDQLYETVTQRLATLPDAVVVYPGHGAGSPCGKKIGDAAQTTIKQEKRFNYAFQADSKAEFIRSVMGGLPTPPAYYPVMKQINRVGAALLRALPAGEPLSVEDVAGFQATGALVIDARAPTEFGGGHIPGSVSVGLGSSFAIWSGWLTPYDREVVLILPDDARYEEARMELRRIGIDAIAGYLRGGMEAWRASGRPVEKLREMPVEELADHLGQNSNGFRVLDVRDLTEWDTGHISGAHNISAGALAQGQAVTILQESPIAVICGTGYRSSLAASLLQDRGLKHVVTVSGGMTAWNAAGLPTE